PRARSLHGLARPRQRGHPGADVDIHTAENKNLQRLSPSLCRCTIAAPGKNFHAGFVAMHREKSREFLRGSTDYLYEDLIDPCFRETCRITPRSCRRPAL